MRKQTVISIRKRILRVAIVDADKSYSHYLAKLIQRIGFGFKFVGAWSMAEEAISPLIKLNPDVVIVDLALPHLSGAEFIARVSKKLPGSAFLVLTAQTQPKKVLEALRAGADGYLLKNSRSLEITKSIRDISEGRVSLSPEITTVLIQSFLGRLSLQNKS